MSRVRPAAPRNPAESPSAWHFGKLTLSADSSWPTAGTRKTGERNNVPRVVVQGGRLVPVVPSAQVPDWTFSAPLGQQTMVELPFSETITLAHHLKAKAIQSLLNRSALEDVRDASSPSPTVVDEFGRAAQRFELVVRIIQDGAAKRAGARGHDIYAVIAPVVIEAATHLLEPLYQHSGALALAESFDPLKLLRALHGRELKCSETRCC